MQTGISWPRDDLFLNRRDRNGKGDVLFTLWRDGEIRCNDIPLPFQLERDQILILLHGHKAQLQSHGFGECFQQFKLQVLRKSLAWEMVLMAIGRTQDPEDALLFDGGQVTSIYICRRGCPCVGRRGILFRPAGADPEGEHDAEKDSDGLGN